MIVYYLSQAIMILIFHIGLNALNYLLLLIVEMLPTKTYIDLHNIFMNLSYNLYLNYFTEKGCLPENLPNRKKKKGYRIIFLDHSCINREFSFEYENNHISRKFSICLKLLIYNFFSSKCNSL